MRPGRSPWRNWSADRLSRYVDQELSIILLTNLSLCRTERMAHAVAGFVDPELARFRARPMRAAVPNARVTEGVGRRSCEA